MKLAFGKTTSVPSRPKSPPFIKIKLAATFTALTFYLILTAHAAEPQVLRGHVPKAAKRQQPIGNADAAMQLDLAIGLPLRNTNELHALLQQIYQPGNTNFRHYLTSDQFTEKFSPTPQDYESVINFATTHGMTVTGTHSNRAMVGVRGAVSDIEKAFHVKLRLYQHPTQPRKFFAPDSEPSVELDTPLAAISGLNNFNIPHPLIRHDLISPSAKVRPMTGSGSSGSYQGGDFRAAYLPGVTNMGSGQSIGLFELDGFKATDISTYNTEASLPTFTPTKVLIDGFNGSASEADGDDEVALDIDMAHAMAPKAAVVVYEGQPVALSSSQNTSPATTKVVNDILNRMATDDTSLQLSCSWGFDINATTIQIFEQYAAQGQSFFLACGDSGAFAGAVDEPADDPFITVVGGTELTTTGPGGSWVSETTWNSGSSVNGIAATGGGISLVYPIPAWQQGISMSANLGSSTMRNVPDVALTAYNVWIVANGQGGAVGGTSVAAPLWAGVTALVNEQGAATGNSPIGFANPALYAIGKSAQNSASYHDITTGNNTWSGSRSKFFAVTGFDLCTGWGTPAGTNLIQALLSPPAESLEVTPSLGFTAFGPVGGPFNITSQIYTLTNAGASSFNWSLVNTSSWLTVSPVSGTLNPSGPPAVVTVSLNSAATNSLIQSFDANIVFNNLTDGTSQNLEFDLLVGNGGFETGDFTDWTLSGSTDDNFILGSDDTDIDGTEAVTGVNDWLLVHSGLYGALLGQPTSAASLSQTLPTVPGQSYNLSFWLTSVQYKGTTTPNQFSATWNGNTLVAMTNVGTFAWTNYQFTVTATGASTTLQFSDRNDPSGFGLDDISVQPITTTFESAAQNADAIDFTWSAFSGLEYQVQYTDSLSPANWIDLGTPVTATNNTVSASDNVIPTSQRFYRIVLVPQ
ncbi:MAG TPA: protease pro-enzyme activation domain-containing protein [Verrucomicrobiae bacterium]|jgi:subtilase family serine protease